MSPEEERRIGAQEHPRLVKALGGLYDDPALQRYVAALGRRVQQTSEQPEPPFTFVVLDSPEVNAFALPGGYIHVTRGLMALANDEAELAGVIAHEIGHVTARHSAERYSYGVVAGLGAALLGAVIDSDGDSDFAQLAAGAYVKGLFTHAGAAGGHAGCALPEPQRLRRDGDVELSGGDGRRDRAPADDGRGAGRGSVAGPLRQSSAHRRPREEGRRGRARPNSAAIAPATLTSDGSTA